MGTAALAFAAAGCSAESALTSTSAEQSAAAASETPAMVMPLAIAADAPSVADPGTTTEADGSPAKSRPAPEFESAGPPQATAAPHKAAPAEPRPDRHAWRDLD
ncbi:MAG: hypothetical protein C0429_08390 [Sphingopyxis sp.]|nr:hypothetical protein [Sphingopyxis sp.]